MKIVKVELREEWLAKIQASQTQKGLDSSREEAERIYADPTRLQEAQKIELHYGDGRVEEVPFLTMRFVEEAKAKPARPRREAPVDVDTGTGFTAATDSGLPRLIGRSAFQAWCCLLRHANGRTGRRIKGIGWKALRDGTGMSEGQLRGGLERLIVLTIISRPVRGTAKGRPTERRQTAEYLVPFPTPARLADWLKRARARKAL